MRRAMLRYLLALAVVAAALIWNGDLWPTADRGLTSTAEALIGRPATPLSYAGVARRTTRRAVTPGVGYGGAGGPASGVGVLPGLGVGQAGVGYSRGVGVNLGGPVNRVGIR